jgi:hypothetical protein
VTAVILLLLIPAAYYTGKYNQWRADFKRTMRMQRSMGMRHRGWLRTAPCQRYLPGLARTRSSREGTFACGRPLLAPCFTEGDGRRRI